MQLKKSAMVIFVYLLLVSYAVPFFSIQAQGPKIIGGPEDSLRTGEKLSQRSDNYAVTWTLLQEYPFQVQIEVENLGAAKNLELASIFKDFSVPLEKVEVTGFYEWKTVSKLIPEKTQSNFIGYDKQNNTIFENVTIPAHYEETTDWVPVRSNYYALKGDLSVKFDAVDLPAKSGGSNKKTFRLDFNVPMGKNADGSFGCSGEVNLQLGDEVFHPWFNSTWGYRKYHNITHATGAGAGYQTCIIAYYGTGTDGVNYYDSHDAGKCYLNSHSQTDFDDVRFCDNDETTLLDYWAQYVIDSTGAVFWVEIADDISSDDTAIWVYYGNEDVDTASDGDATFLFFDDFDTLDDWTDVGGGNWAIVDDGGLSVMASSSGDDDFIYPTDFEDGDICRVRARARFNNTGASMMSLCTRFYNSGTFYRTGAWSMYYHTVEIWKRISGSWTSLIDDSSTQTQSYVYYEAQNVGTALRCYKDYTLQLSTTDSSLAAGGGYDNIAFRRGFNGGTTCYFVDWVFVSKLAASEPAHGTWGTEEEPPPTPTPTPTPTAGPTSFDDSLAMFLLFGIIAVALGLIGIHQRLSKTQQTQTF